MGIIRVLLLQQFLIGIVSGIIAYFKKRNIWNWFVLGLILGPIALIILRFLPSMNMNRVCPSCGKMLGKEDKKCHYCQDNITEDIELGKGDYTVT